MHSPDQYSLHGYGRMINDRRRSQPFVDALRRLVTPDSVVLEIGTATGYFALLCAQLGARHVYAVEPDDAIEVARLCAKDVPGSERITWIKDLSTAIELPQRADIVLGDLHGTLPFYNRNIESMADARRRHLAPGGVMIPRRDVLRVVPAQAPHEYAHVDAPWTCNDEGLAIGAGRPFVANQWWRARAEPANADDLLAPPAQWAVIDYASVDSADVDGRLQFTIERGGTLHGYYVWFDGELCEGIGYSNAPDLPELAYGRAFFPLEHACTVLPGDVVELRMAARSVGDQLVLRWDSRITTANGEEKARHRQSTFRSRPITPATLRRALPEHVPQLGEAGRVDRMVLDGMACEQPLQAIAAAVAEAFPARFRGAADAMQRVASLSLKYSL